jgi:hypothetical protein
MRDDINSNEDRHDDSADALANLAGGNAGEIVVPDETDKVDPLSALDAMAQDDCDAVDPGEFAAAAETVENDVSDDVFAGEVSLSEATDREHVTVGAGYHRHHAHMYKKTMIPLMLVVGAMLVLIGFIAVVMVLRAEPDDKFYTWYGRMKIVMYVSFPLAAMVLVGAWWFRQDVNK